MRREKKGKQVFQISKQKKKQKTKQASHSFPLCTAGPRNNYLLCGSGYRDRNFIQQTALVCCFRFVLSMINKIFTSLLTDTWYGGHFFYRLSVEFIACILYTKKKEKNKHVEAIF